MESTAPAGASSRELVTLIGAHNYHRPDLGLETAGRHLMFFLPGEQSPVDSALFEYFYWRYKNEATGEEKIVCWYIPLTDEQILEVAKRRGLIDE